MKSDLKNSTPSTWKRWKTSIFCRPKPELRWRVKKFDIVIVFYVSGLPSKSILSQCFFASWAVIAVYRFTSGFPGASGYPEPSRPGPSCSSTLKLCTWPKFGPLILLSNYLSLKIRYSRLFRTLNYFKPEVYSCKVVKLVELGPLANFEPSQMTHLVILD